mmetsp:Transcript_58046/g.52280  ORF Transcript_58046/g.52280 Transcript_58046/m.52280 type:complete len:355 (-) Transcript_58046:146-1210(-)|eukprot:CAMPEP_0201563816 /NCGR_PEP_ID=MMETSP0190_2-20130828/1283_1 /ASSEMBLY_ACC=CAM_ASM_000263 /TAXON_ID=37353 /ORGANISM="Rosalina sp." /LENGTH=354 /DNA_ID=CAMNT_0047979097 /DNA_START=108 /DNA_END=1172 /DNA_ORIENTATION=+
MKYTFAVLALCIILVVNSTKRIQLSCRAVQGSEVRGGGEISRAKCPRRTTLVSCGINGWHNIGGTIVRPSRDNVCEAELSEDVTTTQPYGVAAVANCCRFPIAADAESLTRLSSTAGRKVQAECPKPSSLTGCTVDYDSGSTNNIKGSYAGKAILKRDERNTKNTCTAQARDGSTDVIAGAQCIKLGNSKYNLECKAVTKYGTRDDLTEANTCPMGTQLLSCMTYSTTLTLDDWYIKSTGPTCYVQQDNYENQYANGVCCKLTKTGKKYGGDEDDELFDYVISVDEDDEEEGYMFVPVNQEMMSVANNSTSMALFASVILLLVIGFGLYKCCVGNNGGYKRLATNDNDPLLTKV